MAITVAVDLVTAALWPQGDIRDPLGVWGARVGVTGDASGNPITVTIQAAADQNAAYLYTCYSVNISQFTGTIVGMTTKLRLLTGWPDIDPVAGVQAYGSAIAGIMRSGTLFTPPLVMIDAGFPLLQPNDRFLLLFDPRATAGALAIVLLEIDENTLAATYGFEAYGYYWDRSVLQAPGGPRHPGSS